MKADDGTTVTATFQFSTILTTSAATNTWQSLTSDPLPCSDFDSARDAIVVGTVAFENGTPTFTPDVRFMFPGLPEYTDFDTSVGVDYGNSPSCIDPEGGITPNFSEGSSWGPVPIEIVLRQFYSPSDPAGAATARVSFNAIVSQAEGLTADLSDGSGQITIASDQMQHVGVFEFSK
jgi:hypothetical protein